MQNISTGIPIIDITCLCVCEPDVDQVQRVVTEVHRAVKDIGFMYIVGAKIAEKEVYLYCFFFF